MSIPSTIAEYLSCFSQELGDRILQIYPALQAPQYPVSERFKTLLRSPFAAQRLAVMGIVKRGQCAKAAAVIAECGTGKTLMALSAKHRREVAPRGSNHRPRGACLHHRRLANTGQSGANPQGVNEVRYRNGRIVREGLHTTLTDLRLQSIEGALELLGKRIVVSVEDKTEIKKPAL